MAEIKKTDVKGLKERIAKVRGEVQDLYLDKNTGKLTNLRAIKNKRKDIAQMLTVLNQKIELEKLEKGDPSTTLGMTTKGK